MSRQQTQKVATFLITTVATLVVIPVLLIILTIFYNGMAAISWEFLTQPPRNGMTEGGIMPAILGTILLTLGTAVAAIPLGIGAAIYLAEYAGDNILTRTIRLAIVNLAGIPSIVYGLFGLGMFVLFFQFGTSILAGSLTLGLMTLPIVISTAEEAILTVPQAFRTVSYSVDATRWQTIRHQVLPNAMPGIITGIILVFIPCLGSFLTPDLLGGANAVMIGNVIERQFKAANDWPFGAAISFLLMYATFGALALRALFARFSKGVGV
ncbi:MAG: phosphate ABC transporter permease PstA [Anaerolineae bacterium]|nr:phosphate ABC transporter permease PstA [Anaerolineae bacterium]